MNLYWADDALAQMLINASDEGGGGGWWERSEKAVLWRGSRGSR